ncbi:hypothetical protein [Salinispora pacifica]|uniref:hypothetical protein n=1 Tax=Salinispora pacifica TaxID=351187 RepID=UPI0004BAF4D9|nr:hypothetical protein [Salinispora pacifica]
MFGRTTPPAASAAVHVLNPRKKALRGLCGVDLTGEVEMPPGTTITCPVCARKHKS